MASTPTLSTTAALAAVADGAAAKAVGPRTFTQPGEREFGVAELFFSSTDHRGVIRRGNPVFARVSDYDLDEMIGRPHNLVRHPDMPRCVFQLLWDELGAGRSVSAYVKNRAKDGQFYWVLACAFPSGDGYVSVRLKPTAGILPTVESLYADLRGFEGRLENAGERRSAVIAQSLARMHAAIEAAGLGTYNQFIRNALASELRSRHGLVGDRTDTVHPDGPYARLWNDTVALEVELRDLFGHLDLFESMNDVLLAKSAFFTSLSSEVTVASLNAVIAAGRIRHDAEVLTAIAGVMHEQGTNTAERTQNLTAATSECVDAVAELAFSVAGAQLLCEMALFYIGELDAPHAASLAGARSRRQAAPVTWGDDQATDDEWLERDAFADDAFADDSVMGHQAGPEAAAALVELLDALRERTNTAAKTLERLSEERLVVGGQIGQLEVVLRSLEFVALNLRLEVGRRTDQGLESLVERAGALRKLTDNARNQIMELRTVLSGDKDDRLEQAMAAGRSTALRIAADRLECTVTMA